jgi:hypothetical protein
MFDDFVKTEKDIATSGSNLTIYLVIGAVVVAAIGGFMATRPKPVKPKEADVVKHKMEKRKQEQEQEHASKKILISVNVILSEYLESLAPKQKKAPKEEESKFVEQEWNKVDEAEFVAQLEENLESDEKSQDSEFYCDLCSKSFKTDSQLTQHEKSKKHLQLLKELERVERKQIGKVQETVEEEEEVEDEEENTSKKTKAEKRNKKALRKQKKKQAFEDNYLEDSNLE